MSANDDWIYFVADVRALVNAMKEFAKYKKRFDAKWSGIADRLASEQSPARKAEIESLMREMEEIERSI